MVQDEHNLPPLWIDMQEDLDDKIQNIENLIKELEPLQRKRFGQMLFDDEGARKLDDNISQLVRKITNLIKNSESKLKDMRDQGLRSLSQSSSTFDSDHKPKSPSTPKALEQVILNIRQNYLNKLQ